MVEKKGLQNITQEELVRTDYVRINVILLLSIKHFPNNFKRCGQSLPKVDNLCQTWSRRSCWSRSKLSSPSSITCRKSTVRWRTFSVSSRRRKISYLGTLNHGFSTSPQNAGVGEATPPNIFLSIMLKAPRLILTAVKSEHL